MAETLLTLISSQGGCAAKIGPDELQKILIALQLPDPISQSIIHNREDAGFLQIDNTQIQIVQSIDVIAPVSDDPWTLGAISTAHALSDLYAKGAKPISGLAFLGLPSSQVSTTTATKILQGAIDKLSEAGAFMLGGHTISSKELQIGLSVTGIMEGNGVFNTGCQEGDVLILTKPLGSGIIVTALKLHNAGFPIQGYSNDIVKNCEQTMLELNAASCKAMVNIGAHACTDVTGFGLIGHLMEMLYTSKLSAVIEMQSIPIMPGAIEFADQDISSSGGERNAVYWWKECQYAGESISYWQKMILFDPQTSGGLLISVAQERAEVLLDQLRSSGIKNAKIIGRIISRADTAVIVSS